MNLSRIAMACGARVAALLLVALPPPCAGAGGVAAAPVMTEADFLGDVPIVLSASRLSQPVAEAPVAVSVIDRDMIRASGFRDIAELFRLVPGFSVANFNGNWPVVSYHGMADQYARRMQVLVDGRSIYTPLFGGVHWADLPLALEDIERIEVVRGPNAASYGANAFLGVINIITRDASQDRGGYASFNAGEKGIRDGMLRFAGGQGGMDYRLTAGYRADDGFDGVHDSRRVKFMNLRGDYRWGSRDTLQFQFGAKDAAREQGTMVCFLDCLRTELLDGHFEQLRWQHDLNAGNEVSVQFFHDYLRDDNSGPTGPVPQPDGTSPQFFVADRRVAERYDLELQQILALHEQWRMVWGASWRSDQLTAPAYFSSDQGSHLFRLFGHAEWRVTPDLLVNAGAMLENNSITGTDISPRFALNYRLAPRHTLRASVSQAMRTPAFFEESTDNRYVLGSLFVQWHLSQRGLKPERITSRELGYVGDFPALGLAVDVKLFSDRLDDLINNYDYAYPADQLTGITTGYRNQEAATIKGWETQVRYRPGRGSQVVLNFARVFVAATDPWLEQTMPVNTVSLLASTGFVQDWSGSAGYYQTSGAYGGLQPLSRRLDLRLAKRFRTGRSHGEFALTLQNVLREQQEFNAGNAFDRRVFGSLGMEL